MARNTSGLKRGGSPGRPKGVPNRATREMREAARVLLENEKYQKKLRADLEARKLNPAVETMLYYYAYGKPAETVKLGGSVSGPPIVIIPPGDAQADA